MPAEMVIWPVRMDNSEKPYTIFMNMPVRQITQDLIGIELICLTNQS
jgi:hypothetical protein